jgi:hypothetical protein
MCGPFHNATLRQDAESSPTSLPDRPDLIFVLAGRQTRKLYGLSLWRQGVAKHLLLSVDRFEIRRFAELALPVWQELWDARLRTLPAMRHFFVSFDGSDWGVERVPLGHFGTLSEIRALKNWLYRQAQDSSLLIVTDSMHVFRVNMCCRRVLGRHHCYHCIGVPGNRAEGARGSWLLLQRFLEWFKILVYAVVLAIPGETKG